MRACSECRYWSEMIAAVMDGALKAMCLHHENSQRWTAERDTCEHWKSGHHGAVDTPPNYGEAARAEYEREDKPAGDNQIVGIIKTVKEVGP